MRVQFTPETIAAARQSFADGAMACIEEVQSGAVHVNDPEGYFAWRRECARRALAGEYDHSFAFWQRAVYIQTGECPALLP